MRIIEHARPVSQRRRVGQLFFGGLLDDALKLFQDANGFLKAHRVSDLDRAGQSFLRLDGFEGLEIIKVRSIQRVGPLSLGHDNARQP